METENVTLIGTIFSVIAVFATSGLWIVTHRWNGKRARIADFNYYIVDQIMPLLKEMHTIEIDLHDKSLSGIQINFGAYTSKFIRFRYRFNLVLQNAVESLNVGDLYAYFSFDKLDDFTELLQSSGDNYNPLLFRRASYSIIYEIHTNFMARIIELRPQYVEQGQKRCSLFISKYKSETL